MENRGTTIPLPKEFIHQRQMQYLHKLLKDFRSRRLAMINKDRSFFQYNSGDLVYIIPPLMSQLRTSSRKVAIKCIYILSLHVND